jgi:hypothetical protein
MKISTRFCLPLAAGLILSAGSLFGQSYPSSIHYFSQGASADGVTPVKSQRSNENNALGEPQRSDVNMGEQNGNSATVNFFSLGYMGEIILEFAQPFCNGPGDDIKVWETSYNTPSCTAWPEKALVWAAQEVCEGTEGKWYALNGGNPICQDAGLDLGDLKWARYIRIMDYTNPAFPAFINNNQDAFDVDGVEAFYACDAPEFTVGGQYSPFRVEAIAQGQRKNGTDVLASRSIQSRMLGAPQMSDVATPAANNNFYSLGFGGTVTLEFPYAIFNVAGADIQMYETTFGDNAARPCSSFPEKATFEGSVDGVNFFDLEVVENLQGDQGNTLCRDGLINLPEGVTLINYIRVTDVTAPGSFSSVMDGYDIDGLVGLNQACAPSSNAGGKVEFTGEEIGEGELVISIYPNPTADIATIAVNAVNNVDANYSIRVFDVLGRQVSSEAVNSSNGQFMREVNISGLPAGIYTVSVESNNMKEVSRLVKK